MSDTSLCSDVNSSSGVAPLAENVGAIVKALGDHQFPVQCNIHVNTGLMMIVLVKDVFY